MGMYYLSDADVALLQRVINDHKGKREAPPRQGTLDQNWSAGEDHQAPEVYVAKPQTNQGIPKLLPTDGSETGTSTLVSGSLYDEPGQARCDIFKIIYNDTTGDPELHPISGLSKMVYNLQGFSLTQDWMTVLRTKSGKWVVATASAGRTEWAKLSGGLIEGGSTLANIWEGGPLVEDLTDSGEIVTVAAPPLLVTTAGTSTSSLPEGSLETGSWVLIALINGFWWVIGAQC
jgi:hypothetical protein